jgi:hypothetical protein
MTMTGAPLRPPTPHPVRWVLLVLGVGFTGIAALGAFVPLLPTTPFLLLAAACFVRSSPALHRRLLANRAFGPYLAQWQRDRSIPRAAKRKAYVLVFVTFAISIAVVTLLWLRVLLLLLMASLIAFLAWLPTTLEPGSDVDP